MLLSLKKGEGEKLFFNVPLTDCNPGFEQPSGMWCRDSEVRIPGRAGRSLHSGILMGKIGAENALCSSFGQQRKPLRFTAFGKAREASKQDEGGTLCHIIHYKWQGRGRD